jgi:uncharacterized membrane protein
LRLVLSSFYQPSRGFTLAGWAAGQWGAPASSNRGFSMDAQAHGRFSASGGCMRELAIRRIFRVSLLLKAAHSVLELVGGVALYVASNDAILRLTRLVTSNELLEDPNDLVANFLLKTAESLSLDQKSAASIYLFSHGAIKLFLVVMVLRDRPWAYPLFMIALVFLIAYQSYQLTLGFSPWLAVLTAFDVVVLWLTWHEYRLNRASQIPH